MSANPADYVQRRRTDPQPGQPVAYRDAMGKRLRQMVSPVNDFGKNQLLLNAAETLERDEEENAAMIQVLVNAGYRDIPARVDRELIKRLLGYISPGV